MPRFAALLVAAGGAAALWLAPPGSADLRKAAVHAPKPGAMYSGSTEERQRVSLRIGRRTIAIAAFRFRCGRKTIGITSLEAIPLRRGDRGYRFKVSTAGIVSYEDEQPDENGVIAFRGDFSASAKTVTGLLRVKTPRCHDTGYLEWRASRRSG